MKKKITFNNADLTIILSSLGRISNLTYGSVRTTVFLEKAKYIFSARNVAMITS